MSKRHRNRRQIQHSSAPAQQPVASSWGWRGGVSTSRGFDGAKYRDALRSAYPTGYDLDAEALRDRSRSAYWDSTQARALLARLVDNVIGTGLTLRSAPAWNLIRSSMTEEQRRAVSDEIDERWRLWAESHEPDAAGRRNLAELQAFFLLNELRDGDLPLILRYSGDTSRVSRLNIQALDASQLDTRKSDAFGAPGAGLALDAQARGNTLHDGLELTSSGEIVAIYVLDPAKPYGEPTRVPVKGSRRRFVVMPAIIDLPGQVRGVGPLAALVHELQKLGDYEVAELEAAVVNAAFAAYIKPGATTDTRTSVADILGAKASAATASGQPPEIRLDQPGRVTGGLAAGEDLVSFDTKRPNVNFGQFVDTVTKALSASLSIPVEVLNESFNANYSASRAALIMFWNTVERWRVHVVSQILAPIYEAWLSEEVDCGRLPALTANGFLSDPVRRRAWLQADWVGDSMPSIDPLKEANADDIRIAQGATTRERVALKYNRSDYYDNAARLKREAEILPPDPNAAADARSAIPTSDEPGEGADKPDPEEADQ